ncbi:MAG: DUF308 domain-containing protein [Chromatiaceae bacterium]|jgi:uncharacterized membrane protein HdeD (DUF308 family)
MSSLTRRHARSLSRISLHERRIAEHWQHWTVFGALGILAGAAAVLLPGRPGLSAAAVLAIPLLLDGFVQCCHAGHIRRHFGAAWRLLGGAISVGTGTLLLSVPLEDILPLGLAIGVFLLHSGLVRCLLAAFLEPLQGWSWLSNIGAIAVMAGLGLLFFGADAAPTLLGPLLGLLMMLDGAWLALTAWAARRQWPRGLQPTVSSEPRRGQGIRA